MMSIFNFFEKYGFALVLLFCFGFFTPDLTLKEGLMLDDSYASISDGPATNVKKQVFWITMFLFFSWRCVINNVLDKQRFVQVLAISSLCFIGIISCFWSNFPALTFKRSMFQLVFCISVILSFYYALIYNTLEKILFFSGVLIIILIFISILTGVGFNASSTLTGFSPGKNILGQNLLVYTILIFLYLKVNKKSSSKLLFLLFFLLFLLFLTASKTSIILIFTFLFIGYVIPKFTVPLMVSTFVTFYCVFILIPCLSFYFGDIIHIGQYLSPDALTGRGVIWNTLYSDISFFQKVDFGYGYGTYFNTGTPPPMFDNDWSFLSKITSTHNGYVDMLMQFGFYGLSVLLMVILFLFRKINNHWLAAALLIAIIYNLTEAAFYRNYSMMWMMVLVISAYISTSFNKKSNI